MQNIFLQVGTPEWNELLNAVRVEARLTTQREMDESKDVWLTTNEAMAYMKVDCPNTLVRYRSETDSPIVYSKPSKDVLYLKESLNRFLIWKKK